MPIEFIGDLGSNHNQNKERCIDLILAAKEAGCTTIKLQIFKAEELYAPQYKEQIELLKSREFPLEWLPSISKFCKEYDIKLGVSVFYLDAVEYVAKYVDFLKVSSYELLWSDLIKEYNKTKLPIMLSTGLADANEVVSALQYCNANKDLTIFHCNSTYPAEPKECNLVFLKELKRYANKVGWSDHTCEPGVIFAAINYGAEIIEFHLDLDDMKGVESEYGHCWSASKISKVINDVRIMEITMKSGDIKNKEELRLERASRIDGLRPCRELR